LPPSSSSSAGRLAAAALLLVSTIRIGGGDARGEGRRGDESKEGTKNVVRCCVAERGGEKVEIDRRMD
jgi:hypothetical protein